MADLTETEVQVSPNLDGPYYLVFFTAAKTAQSDTVTFDTAKYGTLHWCDVFVQTTGAAAVKDTPKIDATTAQLVTLGGTTVGTVSGMALLEEL